MRCYAVYHRVCRHVCVVDPDRATAERARALLAAAGYYQWRVEAVSGDALDAVLGQFLAGLPGTCGTCRIDPSRASLPAVQALAGEVDG